MARPDVIQRDEEAVFPVGLDEFFQRIDLLDIRLDDLNDDALGIQSGFLHLMQDVSRTLYALIQDRSLEIDGQKPFRLAGLDRFKRLKNFFAAEPIQGQGQTFGSGPAEKS